MPFDDRERTEAPTARRRQEARRKGQVARSQEINSAVILLASVGLFYFLGGPFAGRLMDLLRSGLAPLPGAELTQENSYTLLVGWGWRFLTLMAPFFFGLMVAGVAANALQVGFVMSEEALSPKWERLNPVRGLGNLLGRRGLVEIVKSPLKLFLIGVVAYFTIAQRAEDILRVGGMPPVRAVSIVWEAAFALLVRVAMSVCVLGLLDYLYQRWEHERSLRMTKEEVKDELRQSEGDPLVKARIRSLQKQVAMRRMMAAVPKADVVLTNPVHLAVALRYDERAMRAPKVVAKGPRLVAERIVEAARRHGVPIVENKPLARSLYKLVAVGQEIPAALYRAVAEILAYVYALSGRRGQ